MLAHSVTASVPVMSALHWGHRKAVAFSGGRTLSFSVSLQSTVNPALLLSLQSKQGDMDSKATV